MVDELDAWESTNANNGDRSLLASVRRAIDDSCRNQRRDVLVDAVIVLLAKRVTGTTEDILQDLRRLFRSQAIPFALADRALRSAFSAGLVEQVRGPSRPDAWVLTDAAKRDVREDELWATHIIDRFDADARLRLDSYPDRDQISDHRIAKVAESVRQALAIGCQGLYGVQPATTPETAQPVEFNRIEAFKHLRSIEPKLVRNAAKELLISALNPDDNFGDEYIHLLVAGNVLHAMATRRDLGIKPSLRGVRLVFDTSAIVDLTSTGTDEAREIVETIRLSIQLGVEVVVPQHVIDEWIALFNAADNQIPNSAVTVERFGILGVTSENIFIRSFNADSSGNAQLTWAEFRMRWSDPSAELELLGVTIRPHYNDRDIADDALVQVLARELRTLNRKRQEDGRRLRTTDGIIADANSLTMVARWRAKSGPDSAFFISRDTMSSAAYIAVRRGDEIPITVTLPAWLIFVASLIVDDPESKSELAQVIGNAALRISFFGLCSCYSYREIVEFSNALQQDEIEIGPDDITTFIQQKMAAFEDEAEITSTSPTKEGARVLMHRSLVRSQRARHADDVRESTIQDAVDHERNVAKVALHAQEIEHQGIVSDLTTTITDKEEKLTKEKRTKEMWVRIVASLVVTAVLFVVILLLWNSRDFDRRWKSQLIIGGVLWVILSGWWVKEGSKNTLALALTVLLLPNLISILFLLK